MSNFSIILSYIAVFTSMIWGFFFVLTAFEAGFIKSTNLFVEKKLKFFDDIFLLITTIIVMFYIVYASRLILYSYQVGWEGFLKNIDKLDLNILLCKLSMSHMAAISAAILLIIVSYHRNKTSNIAPTRVSNFVNTVTFTSLSLAFIYAKPSCFVDKI